MVQLLQTPLIAQFNDVAVGRTGWDSLGTRHILVTRTIERLRQSLK